MWNTSFRSSTGKFTKVKKTKYCLLIGNTRWHWAIQKKDKWYFFHAAPSAKSLKKRKNELWRWAAVGAIPKDIELAPSKCIRIKDIPLLKLPDWIGIDRALAGWAAYKKAKAKNLHSQGLLIADAGTILSLTVIKRNGEFDGGQLVAGLKLQRTAMAMGTEKLHQIKNINLPEKQFPITTEQAMLRGSFQALLGTLLEAQRTANMPVWLCGGDSEILFKSLQNHDFDIYHYPDLVLEGMTQINLPINQELNLSKSDLP